jgi:hypothetical protein
MNWSLLREILEAALALIALIVSAFTRAQYSHKIRVGFFHRKGD